MRFIKGLLLILFVFSFSNLFSEDLIVNDNFSTMENWQPAPGSYGSWKIINGRLVQEDVSPGLAKINRYVPQSGVMQYEFDVLYVDHGDDAYGAFGIHVFVNKPAKGISWGNGRSFLLWITFDPEVYGGTGFRAQCYKSENHSTMDEISTSEYYAKGGFEIPVSFVLDNIKYIYLEPEFLLKKPVKLSFIIDSNKGIIIFKDPLIPNWEWSFVIGESIPEGSYISLRTSSLSVSFDNFKVIKLK